jgi:hypothetical protein
MPMSTLFREHVINVAHAEFGGWQDLELPWTLCRVIIFLYILIDFICYSVINKWFYHRFNVVWKLLFYYYYIIMETVTLVTIFIPACCKC